MTKTVIALFDDVGRAQHAYEALKVGGFANERIEVQTGEDLARSGHAPPAESGGGGFRAAIQSFFDELGLTTPEPPPAEGEYRPLARGDRVIVLETSDERADQAAAILDREGAVNVEERRERPPGAGRGAAAARGARIYPPTKAQTGDYAPRAPRED